MFTHLKVGLGVVAFGLIAGRTWAATPPATSLNGCQNAVRTATKQFVAGKTAAIGTCLQAVSTQIVKNNKPNASGAAQTCVTAFRKLNDSRGLGRQLSDKLAAAIAKKCAPGQTGVTHTLADILGSGAGVPQPLDAENLNAWCGHFGGDGSLDSVDEWIACVTAAAECDVDASLAAQFPRVLEWLNLARAAMQAVAPPATDPAKISDAVAGLAAVQTALDPTNDDVVNIQCGSRQTCGNNLAEGSEVCDGTDLHGQTCAIRTAATPYGTLACDAGCAAFVTASCVGRFVDNGDGTVTDNHTTLVWEKKDLTCPGPHCWTDQFTWSTGTNYPDGTAFTGFLATLNGGAALGSSGDGTTCTGAFAGYCDWRLPTIMELQSILLQAYPCTTTPCIAPVFGPTIPAFFWAATTYAGGAEQAWDVRFSTGSVQPFSKTAGDYVRAVRGKMEPPTNAGTPAHTATATPTSPPPTATVTPTQTTNAAAAGAACSADNQCSSDHCGPGGAGTHCCAAACTVGGVCGATDCGPTGACTYPSTSTAAGQTAGNCQRLVCNGAGGVTAIDDPTNLPTSNTVCLIPACSAPSPLHPSFTFAPTGTDCTADNQFPRHVCGTPDNLGIAGQCVECNTNADCLAINGAGTLTCNSTIGVCQ
jgi:hypothetical protein